MQQFEREGRNPWKIATIAIVASLAGAISGGIVVASVPDAGPETDTAAVETTAAEQETVLAAAEAAPTAVAPAPAPQPRENCERYAAAIDTDGGRVVKNGLVGTAVGAGLGAAGGAIADGGSGAGKGAGIGALVGAAAGTAYGLNEESKKKDQARRDYEACLARNR
jgi:hypothetical protein